MEDGAGTHQICQNQTMFPGQHGAVSGCSVLFDSVSPRKVAQIEADPFKPSADPRRYPGEGEHFPLPCSKTAPNLRWIQHRPVGLLI